VTRTIKEYVVLALALASGASAQTSGAGAPTFYEDVLPILQENCQACHQPNGRDMGGMLAPFSLLTYADVASRAQRVSRAVASGQMPPWHAASWQKGTFANERVLEEEEKQIIVAWAEGGTPAGDPTNAPPTPDFVLASAVADGWTLGEPDLILGFEEPYCLRDRDQDVYVDIPVHITAEMVPEDRWMASIEYRNGPAIHHIVSDVGGLVPGGEPRAWGPGDGNVFRAGPRDLLFNMHFNKEAGRGTAVCTNIQAGIRFKPEGEIITHVMTRDDLMISPIWIPAGAPNHSHVREYRFAEDVEILSFFPHMHLRGKAARYAITYPDGRYETLLDVPRYDFNWQHTYRFAEPVFAPAGSVLRFTLWWDNSANNPHNPDPSADVQWGLPTHSEMSQGYMTYQRLDGARYIVGEPIPPEVRQENQSH
jgi:hypothetical protein